MLKVDDLIRLDPTDNNLMRFNLNKSKNIRKKPLFSDFSFLDGGAYGRLREFLKKIENKRVSQKKVQESLINKGFHKQQKLILI